MLSTGCGWVLQSWQQLPVAPGPEQVACETEAIRSVQAHGTHDLGSYFRATFCMPSIVI